MRVANTGLGGWSASGCMRTVDYVCAYRTCAQEGPVTATGAPRGEASAESWQVGTLDCVLFGASESQSAETMGAFRAHRDELTSCGTQAIAAAVASPDGRLEVMRVAARDETCARTVLASIVVPHAAVDHTIRCERR